MLIYITSQSESTQQSTEYQKDIDIDRIAHTNFEWQRYIKSIRYAKKRRKFYTFKMAIK